MCNHDYEPYFRCRHCNYVVNSLKGTCINCNKELAYPIAERFKNHSFNEIKRDINNAFFRLECFLEGLTNDYEYFGFNDAFTVLLNEALKPENFTYETCELMHSYWQITDSQRLLSDKGDYPNVYANENKSLLKDWEELGTVNWHRIGEFRPFCGEEESDHWEDRYSIKELLLKFGEPDIMNEERKKYHAGNYWNTALRIKKAENLTWEKTYEYIVKRMRELGLETKYTSYESFNAKRKEMRIKE